MNHPTKGLATAVLVAIIPVVAVAAIFVAPLAIQIAAGAALAAWLIWELVLCINRIQDSRHAKRPPDAP